MKKSDIWIMVLCIALLLCGCGNKEADSSVSKTGNTAPQQLNKPTVPEKEDPVIDITEQMQKIEYAIILSEIEEQTYPNPTSWALYDGDHDGSNELYVDAVYNNLPAGEWGGLRMLADMDSEILWGASVIGSFGGVEWVQSSSDKIPCLYSYHVSAGSPLRRYSSWNGSAWTVSNELYRSDSDEIVCFWGGESVTFESFQQKENESYLPTIVFDSPVQQPVTVDGQPEAVLKALNDYWSGRAGFVSAVSGDIDGDNQEETLYCINSAFQLWKDRLNLYESSDPLDAWNDLAITILIADQNETQTRLSMAKIPVLGNNISCDNGALIVDEIRYIYDDGAFMRDVSGNPDTSADTSAQAQISDEELLKLANERVVEQFNFVYYLDAGAVFKQDWLNTSDDPTTSWYQVVDERIHSMQDIRNVWYSYFSKTSVMPNDILHCYKESNGTVYTRNEGVGDNFVGIQLNSISERTNGYAVIRGDQLFIDPWGENNMKAGDITYKMVLEDGEWKCEEILLNGKAWSFYEWH